MGLEWGFGEGKGEGVGVGMQNKKKLLNKKEKNLSFLGTTLSTPAV